MKAADEEELPTRVVRQDHREVVGSPSLKVFRSWLDGHFLGWFSQGGSCLEQADGLHGLVKSLPARLPYDPMLPTQCVPDGWCQGMHAQSMQLAAEWAHATGTCPRHVLQCGRCSLSLGSLQGRAPGLEAATVHEERLPHCKGKVAEHQNPCAPSLGLDRLWAPLTPSQKPPRYHNRNLLRKQA